MLCYCTTPPSGIQPAKGDKISQIFQALKRKRGADCLHATTKCLFEKDDHHAALAGWRRRLLPLAAGAAAAVSAGVGVERHGGAAGTAAAEEDEGKARFCGCAGDDGTAAGAGRDGNGAAGTSGHRAAGVVRAASGSGGTLPGGLERTAGPDRGVVCGLSVVSALGSGRAGGTGDGGRTRSGGRSGELADGGGIGIAVCAAGRRAVFDDHRAGSLFHQPAVSGDTGVFEAAAAAVLAGTVPGCGPVLSVHHFEVAAGGDAAAVEHVCDTAGRFLVAGAGLRTAGGGFHRAGGRPAGAGDRYGAAAVGGGVSAGGEYGAGVGAADPVCGGYAGPHASGTAAAGGAG